MAKTKTTVPKPKAASNTRTTVPKPKAASKTKTTAPKPKAASKTTTTAPQAKAPDPAAVDAWLAKLPGDQRAALQRLRAQIRAAAPGAVETIAWNVPMFYLGMTPVMGLGAFKNHVSLGVGGETLDTMRADLEGYDTAKGTVRFSPDQPLPAALVKKIVKARIALHAAGKAG